MLDRKVKFDLFVPLAEAQKCLSKPEPESQECNPQYFSLFLMVALRYRLWYVFTLFFRISLGPTRGISRTIPSQYNYWSIRVWGLQIYMAKNIRFQCCRSLMYWIKPSDSTTGWERLAQLNNYQSFKKDSSSWVVQIIGKNIVLTWWQSAVFACVVGSAQNRTLFKDDLNKHASRSCLFTRLKKFACKRTYSKNVP